MQAGGPRPAGSARYLALIVGPARYVVFGVLLAAAVLAGAKLAAFLGVSPFLAAVLGGCVCALVVVVSAANAEISNRGR
jgi:hypothetical protein